VGYDFLLRVRKTALLTALVAASLIAIYVDWMSGVAWLAGCTWSLVNLAAIASLVRLVLADGERQDMRIALVMFAKVPVLYFAGFMLLKIGTLPIAWMLAGFLWPIAITLLKAIGRVALGMDKATQTAPKR